MLNKTYSLNHIVYLVGLHVYYKMIHDPYNVKLKRMGSHSRGLKWQMYGTDHPPPSNAKVKEELQTRVDSRAVPLFLVCAFAACYRVNFTFFKIKLTLN